jgi:hypothetical protein
MIMWLTPARNLNPGGWFEVQDIKFPMEYNDDNYPRDSAVHKWNEFIMESTLKFGRDADKVTGYKQQLIDAGFENVTEVQYKWPQNTWPKDRKLKEIGELNLRFCALVVSDFSLDISRRSRRNDVTLYFGTNGFNRRVASRELYLRAIRTQHGIVHASLGLDSRRVGGLSGGCQEKHEGYQDSWLLSDVSCILQ